MALSEMGAKGLSRLLDVLRIDTPLQMQRSESLAHFTHARPRVRAIPEPMVGAQTSDLTVAENRPPLACPFAFFERQPLLGRETCCRKVRWNSIVFPAIPLICIPVVRSDCF